MHRPSRTRRILKWTGAALSLLIFVVLVTSPWYEVSARLPGKSTYCLSNGSVMVIYSDAGREFTRSPGVRIHAFEHLGLRSPSIWRAPHYPGQGATTFTFLPLWLPLLLTAIPTAWLWHRDRRRIRHGCCPSCEYDLTSNTSGICPECGDKPPPPAGMADS